MINVPKILKLARSLDFYLEFESFTSSSILVALNFGTQSLVLAHLALKTQICETGLIVEILENLQCV